MNKQSPATANVDATDEAGPRLNEKGPWKESDFMSQTRRARIQTERERQRKSLVRWMLAALLMPFVLGGSIWRDHHLNQQVSNSAPAGELLDLRPGTQSTGIKPVIVVLQTSTSFFSLTDPLSLAPGVALVREERKSGRQYICDTARIQCAEIARSTWF